MTREHVVHETYDAIFLFNIALVVVSISGPFADGIVKIIVLSKRFSE